MMVWAWHTKSAGLGCFEPMSSSSIVRGAFFGKRQAGNGNPPSPELAGQASFTKVSHSQLPVKRN
jgi:hypothetical protein